MMRGAVEAIQHNLGAWALLASIVLTAQLALIGADLAIKEYAGEEPQAGWYRVCVIGQDIVVAIACALGQTLAFTRMGRDLGRPTWKIDGDLEALQRFFSMWFIFNLAGVAGLRAINSLASSATDSSVLTLLLFFLAFASMLTPVGAAVMFYGNAGKTEVNQALNTLADQLPRLMSFVTISFVVTVSTLMLAERLPLWARPLVSVIESFQQCFVFAGTWLVCIYHRDTEPEDQDFDF